jgi:hypothetical protein
VLRCAAEARCLAPAAGGVLGQKGLPWAQVQEYQKWLDRAHRRYLSALKTLATVRRLLVPAVQVNIADKQVNVASGAAPLPSA